MLTVEERDARAESAGERPSRPTPKERRASGKALRSGAAIYGEVCAWCLARAHARSGDRIAIAGYLGSSPAFEHALAEFGEAYADATERDHRQLAEAAGSGRVRAQSDL